MTPFFISIIIPNYNHEKFLDERIQCILNQTYNNYEIIILDDCSTDNSRAVIEKYRCNEYVSHVVYNEKNSGTTFKQWDKGFELAKGELVWIAESDDSCDERFLESLIDSFQDKDIVLTFSRSMQIDGVGKNIGIYPTQLKMDDTIRLYGHEFIKQYLSKTNVIVNASSAIFRKDAINKIAKDYYSYKGCGDWLFWIYIAQQGKVHYCSKPLNRFRQHVKNTTGKLESSGNNPKEVYKIYSFLSDCGYLSKYRKLRFRVSRLANYIEKKEYYEDNVINDVLKVWHFSKVDYILAFMLKNYRMFKKFIS